MERLEEIKKGMKSENQDEWITWDDIEWLIEQVGKLDEIKGLINDERLTKSETVDKISKIVNA